MSLQSAFQELVDTLNGLSIPHMVRGSLASSVAWHISFNFYADPETIQEALQRKRPFNLIHLASGYKSDIFHATGDPYFEVQLARWKAQQVSLAPGGGEQSERQWNDVRGIRSVQGTLLDLTYMRKWARHLQVDDLLERLLSEKQPS